MRRPLPLLVFTVFCLVSVAESAAPVLALKASAGQVPEQIDLPEADAQVILNDSAEYPNDAPASVACQKQDTYDATLDATYRLLCVRVQLAPGEQGLLAMGTGDYRGETDAPFWLFYKDKLVLKVRADEVDVLPQMRGGMRVVTAVHGTHDKRRTETFGFDGVRFVTVR